MEFFAFLLCQLLNDFIFQYSFGNLYFWKDFISCHGLLKLTQTTLTCVYTFQQKRSRIIQKRQIGDSFWRIDIFRDTYAGSVVMCSLGWCCCQGENFAFALEILDQLIDALSDENESES